MISHPHRCIFVHIPKTAGNSINRVFGVGWEDHKDLRRYFDEVPREQFEEYFKFAIVRNPWDRLLSDYNYQVKKSRARDSKLFVFTEDGAKRNFAEWVETALNAPECYDAGSWGGCVSPHIHRWSPQIDWITVDGQTRTDFVARLERLPEDFHTVCHRVGLPSVRLPHRNRRLHWHYSHYYDRATRDLVARYYARDIEAFGYEFDHAFLRIAFNWPFAGQPAGAVINEAEPASARAAIEAPSVPGETIRPSRVAALGAARPPARRRIRNHLSRLAVAASFVLALGIFVRSSIATPLNHDAGAAVPESVRQAILRSAAPVPERASASLFMRARRLGRTMSELKLSFDVLPAIAPGGMVTVSAEPADARRGYIPASAPVVGNAGSGSGPAPRWWIRRNRDDPDN